MKTTLGAQVAALNTIKLAVLELELEGHKIDKQKTALVVLWISLCWKTQ